MRFNFVNKFQTSRIIEWRSPFQHSGDVKKTGFYKFGRLFEAEVLILDSCGGAFIQAMDSFSLSDAVITQMKCSELIISGWMFFLRTSES
jgi:hypothetical protein